MDLVTLALARQYTNEKVAESGGGGGGLEPLIGTTETVTPAQVVEAVQQGRQVVIEAETQGVSLLFSSWTIEKMQSPEFDIAVSGLVLYNDVEASLFTIMGIAGIGWQGPYSASGGGLTPTVTASDKGKFLRVNDNGIWAAESVPSAEGVSF